MALGLLVALTSGLAQAQPTRRLPRLERAYSHIEHPIEDSLGAQTLLGQESPTSSDFARALGAQSPVKDQGSRGSCSIFSSVAWLESYFIRHRLLSLSTDIDLSEEWLEYLAVRGTQEDGSDSPSNFALLSKYGIANEATLPYDSRDWSTDAKKLRGLPRKRCGHIDGVRKRNSCLLAHFDSEALEWSDQELQDSPASELLPARSESAAMLNLLKLQIGEQWPRATAVKTVSEVKALLRAGIPLVLDLDFYMGAWNYDDPELPEVSTNPKHWKLGVVGYPEKGSMDRKLSKPVGAGHSVLCIGYDDNVEVETTVRMQDGSMKSFRYRGVYYFKNSWGTDGFGARFSAQGVRAPGYGMITQKYSHEFGGFFRAKLPEVSP
ncbi:hypothetical protein EBZ37_03965 [bacterium]|nr:hypothetical protein [bacterium]